jgi:hypothetical protein
VDEGLQFEQFVVKVLEAIGEVVPAFATERERARNSHRSYGVQFVCIGEDLRFQRRRYCSGAETMLGDAGQNRVHRFGRKTQRREDLPRDAKAGFVMRQRRAFSVSDIVQPSSGQQHVKTSVDLFANPVRQTTNALNVVESVTAMHVPQTLLNQVAELSHLLKESL